MIPFAQLAALAAIAFAFGVLGAFVRERWLARKRIDSTPPMRSPAAPPDDPAIGRLTEIHRHKGGTIEARVELNERGIAWATAALRNKPKRRPAPTMRTF